MLTKKRSKNEVEKRRATKVPKRAFGVGPAEGAGLLGEEFRRGRRTLSCRPYWTGDRWEDRRTV